MKQLTFENLGHNTVGDMQLLNYYYYYYYYYYIFKTSLSIYFCI